MKVFIAGATGAIGRPLIKSLLESGYEVFAMTRSPEYAAAMANQGAEPVVADALDAGGVFSAVQRIKPEVVIDQLTSLPRTNTREAMRDAATVNTRVRLEGGANLQAAAEAAGVRRYITQSSAFFYAPGAGLAGEDTPFALGASPGIAASTRMYTQVEQRVFSSRSLEAIALRYGFFYGPGTWYEREGNIADQVRSGDFAIIGDGRGTWSFIHIEDAAVATVAAIERANPGAYNIVDDNACEQRVWLPAYAGWLGAPPPPHLPIEEVHEPDAIYYATMLRGASNAKARRELAWRPRPLEWLEASG